MERTARPAGFQRLRPGPPPLTFPLVENMRCTVKITLLALLVLLCLLNIVVVRFIYVRYERDAETVKELQYRVQMAEAKVDLNNRWQTRTITTEIVTSGNDSPDFGSYTLHLDSHTNGTQRFDLAVGKEIGHPVGAWLSEWKPHAEMLKFEEFHVMPNPQTGKIELLAKPITNQIIAMQFTVTVLEQSFTR